MRQPSPPQPLAEARRFRPRIEALEERCNPSVQSFVLGTSALLLVSHGPHDHISIVDNGASAVNNVEVINNGALFVPNINVNTVIVRTRSGNDTVTYRLNGNLVTGATRNIQVNLGTGVNTFQAILGASLNTRSTLNIQAIGGAQDRMNFDASANVNLATSSTLTVVLIGGFNPNLITANYLGQDSGTFAFLAEGGMSADVIDAHFTLTAGSNGSLSAQEFGLAGNDTFTLSIVKVNAFDGTNLSAFIDGGAGANRATVTSNVMVSNVPTIPL